MGNEIAAKAEISLRKAELGDINLLTKMRLDIIEEVRTLSEKNREILEIQLPLYFQKHLPDNTLIAIIAEKGAEVVGSAYLAVTEKLPHTSFPNGKAGTIQNVLTYPAYRGQGIATKVLSCLLEEARLAGVDSVDLSATREGRPVYAKLGFEAEDRTYMVKKLGL